MQQKRRFSDVEIDEVKQLMAARSRLRQVECQLPSIAVTAALLGVVAAAHAFVLSRENIDQATVCELAIAIFDGS